MTTPVMNPNHNPPASAWAPPPMLLTAAQVGRLLNVRAKRVYELGIPQVHLSRRSIRWRTSDVVAWIDNSTLPPTTRDQ